jgi:Enoyl-(Acyl carrier protein) reductase/Bacterial regulatory proteins, gntR family
VSVEPLASLDRSTLRERALESLRSAITSGQYRPGDHLGEVELGKHLGVSRGTSARHCASCSRKAWSPRGLGGCCGSTRCRRRRSAAKAAQLGFARGLARELGQHGITANSVAPGLIGTDITGGALEGERKEQLLAGTPVGRIGNVHDVADLITYLCRVESGYITGVTYDVNGGSTSTEQSTSATSRRRRAAG